MTLLIAGMLMFGLTVVFTFLLGVAKKRLAVFEDPRIALVQEVLPAANCGGCGFAGCADFAKAVVEQRAECTGCPVGGSRTAEKIAQVLGVEVVRTYPYRPVIHCRAKRSDKLGMVEYEGVASCVEANVVGVTQGCTYGCLGFGDCVRACPYDAMRMEGDLPVINYENCTGCGACVRACPRNIIEQIPFKQERMLVIACSNKEPGKCVKAVCKVGCIGCGLCQRLFADLFQVRNNLAYLNYDKYTGENDEGNEALQKVLHKCPADALVYFGKPKPHYAELLAQEEAAASV